MWRLFKLLMLGALGMTVAAAASLSVGAGSLGAATAATPRCTTAGLGVTQTLSGTSVASVTVAGLPAACGGALLQVTVDNGIANGGGSATVPIGGGSVTVTLGSMVPVTAAEQTDLVLVGP